MAERPKIGPAIVTRFGYFEGAGQKFYRHTDRKICVKVEAEWLSHPDAVIARDLVNTGTYFVCERPHPNASSI